MTNTWPEDPESFEELVRSIDWNSGLAEMNDFISTMDESLGEVSDWLDVDSEPDPTTGEVHPRGSILFGIYLLLFAKMVGYDSASDLREYAPEMHNLYVEVVHGLLAQGIIISKGISTMMVTPEVAEYLGLDEYGENG